MSRQERHPIKAKRIISSRSRCHNSRWLCCFLKDALKHLAAHKATGRIVIDMNEEYSECM
jgi:hypothetical protein